MAVIKASALKVGDEVQVCTVASPHCGKTGLVYHIVPGTKPFGVIFDEDGTGYFAFQELLLVKKSPSAKDLAWGRGFVF